MNDNLKIMSIDNFIRGDKKVIIDAITEIDNDADYDSIDLYRNSEYHDCFILCEIDNEDDSVTEVIGFICLEYFKDEIHLDNIIIDNKFRGNGYGTILLNFLRDDILTEQNCNKITLEVSNNNTSATILYLKFGFKIIGFVSEYYDDSSAVYMRFIKEENEN